VWASTEAARFLHGRYVWANWNVSELEVKKPELEADFGFLKIGLQEIPSVDYRTLEQEIRGVIQ
jgi:hypothetical protein